MSFHLKVSLMQCSLLTESVLVWWHWSSSAKDIPVPVWSWWEVNLLSTQKMGPKTTMEVTRTRENKVVKHYANLSLNEHCHVDILPVPSCMKFPSKRIYFNWRPPQSVLSCDTQVSWFEEQMIGKKVLLTWWLQCVKKQASRVTRLTIALEIQQLLVCLRVVFQKNLYRNALATAVWRHCVHTKEPPRHSRKLYLCFWHPLQLLTSLS